MAEDRPAALYFSKFGPILLEAPRKASTRSHPAYPWSMKAIRAPESQQYTEYSSSTEQVSLELEANRRGIRDRSPNSRCFKAFHSGADAAASEEVLRG